MKEQKGFTLIEVIVVLVLVGILAAMAGTGLVAGVQGYLMASENAEISQKAQIAMTRLGREILQCSNCDAGNAPPGNLGTYVYKIMEDGSDKEIDRAVKLVDHHVELGETLNDTFVLVDQVQSCSISRESDGTITITLVINHAQGGDQTFETKILPRNS